MGSPYKTFKTDAEMEQLGIWLDYSEFKIRIARAGGSNTDYNKAVEKYARAYKTAIRNETMSQETQREVLVQVFADAIILEWDGVTDEKDQPIPFTRENVVKLLTDLPDLFDDIRESANKMTLFRRELLERAAKN